MPLLLAAIAVACAAPSEPTEEGFIRVTVVAAPACPEQATDTAECRDRPLTDTGVEIISEGTVLTRTSTGDDGRVTVAVPPGMYTLQVERQPGMVVDPEAIDVDVDAGASTDVTIPIDTGVRDDAAGPP